MEVLNALCWLVAGFSILHNLWAFLNIRFASRWLATKREASLPDHAQTEVAIFLPMFAEQSIAIDAIQYFLKMDYPSNHYRIIVVTTSREAQEREATVQLVSSYVDKHDGKQVLHFIADGRDSCKADQLNQAIAFLNAEPPAWWDDNTIIGVYDADSRPELHSLRDLDRAVLEHPECDAFQQPAIYLQNIDALPSGIHGHYLRSRPLYNLRFCLYRELPAFYRSMKANKTASKIGRILASSPNHFLGHGEFVRRSALSFVGGFPPPSGDTSLGTILSFLGHPIMPLSSFDLGETPKNACMLIRQSSNWYAGCHLYLRDLRTARNLGSQGWLRTTVMIFKRWLENMIWAVGPLLLLAASYWSILVRDVLLAVVCFTGPAIHFVTVLQVRKQIGHLHRSNNFANELPVLSGTETLAALAAYPLMLIGNCVGPLLYYGLLLKTSFSGGEIPRPKTTRSADTGEPEWTVQK